MRFYKFKHYLKNFLDIDLFTKSDKILITDVLQLVDSEIERRQDV